MERGRGSQGACPLAEYEAAPHARLWRARPRSLCSAGRRLGAPTARAALEHVAVMQDAVEHGGDRCHITQQFAPVFDWTILCQQRTRALIATHDDLQQILGRGERQLAHSKIVDDQQRHGGERLHKLSARAVHDGLGQLVE